MKEIRIDGVDVAGCKNYISVYTEDTDTEINNCCTLTYTPCQFEKKNCYYKQLKRAEIEIEKLKGVAGSVHPDSAYYKITRLEQENAELKAENERLKEEIETRDNLIDHFRDEALYRATIASEYQKDKTKFEQTLQEIKEIAEFHITQADSEDIQEDMKQILDLITKAEVGE